ncbi:MAG: presqualene diphosphate synthase HpnD [Rhodobacterales bacterium]|nr:presqualene diphosphate synthase HpnD [Rhodobacterales bacterium]
MDVQDPSVAQPLGREQIAARVRHAGTSFYWAMRVLPPAKRDAMFAVYAFCREVDDIADGPDPEPQKRAALDAWRGAVDDLYAGRPVQDPLAAALAGPIADHGLRQADFLAIIDGMEMDAGARVRLADMDALLLYCDRVAGAVGRLSNRVFGLPDDPGDPLADALGTALQLTNILRDVTEDAARDRLYLPADRLAAHGAGGQDLPDVLGHPATAKVCAELADRAAACFARADALMARCDRRRIRPAVMMQQVYRRILDRLTARGWGNLSHTVRLSKGEKLWLAVRYGVLSA